jgi:hypothetical protein
VFLYGKLPLDTINGSDLAPAGIYSTSFAICLRVLLKNKRTRKKMLLGCALIMFSLATADVVLELGFLFWFVVKKEEVAEDDLHFKFLIYITSK